MKDCKITITFLLANCFESFTQPVSSAATTES